MTGAPANRFSRRGALLTVALLVALGAVVAAVPPLREAVATALRGDTGELRSELRDLGAFGVLVVLALIVSHAVLFYPSEMVNAAAGYVYGFGPALVIVMTGWTLSSTVAYAIGRHIGRPGIHRLAGERRLRRAERTVERGGAIGLLAIRLIPLLPYSLIGYLAGAVRVPLWRFTWTTFAGSLPLCATVVYLGGRLESLSPRDPALWLAIAVTLVLLVGGHLLARRRLAQTGSSASDGPGCPASSSTASSSRPKASPQPQSQARASTSSSGPTAS